MRLPWLAVEAESTTSSQLGEKELERQGEGSTLPGDMEVVPTTNGEGAATSPSIPVRGRPRGRPRGRGRGRGRPPGRGRGLGRIDGLPLS